MEGELKDIQKEIEETSDDVAKAAEEKIQEAEDIISDQKPQDIEGETLVEQEIPSE